MIQTDPTAFAHGFRLFSWTEAIKFATALTIQGYSALIIPTHRDVASFQRLVYTDCEDLVFLTRWFVRNQIRSDMLTSPNPKDRG